MQCNGMDGWMDERIYLWQVLCCAVLYSTYCTVVRCRAVLYAFGAGSSPRSRSRSLWEGVRYGAARCGAVPWTGGEVGSRLNPTSEDRMSRPLLSHCVQQSHSECYRTILYCTIRRTFQRMNVPVSDEVRRGKGQVYRLRVGSCRASFKS